MCIYYFPSCIAESWKALLAKPEGQWKTGYSAKALALSWTEANGFPTEIRKAFSSSDEIQSIIMSQVRGPQPLSLDFNPRACSFIILFASWPSRRLPREEFQELQDYVFEKLEK